MKKLLALTLICAACGNDVVRQASEQVEVTSGEPSVGQGLPGVHRGDGGTPPTFGPAAPFQVDSFDQQPVQQVDILWVVDNSPSMLTKQQRLQSNIHSFMQFLEAQNVDYHLGVVSTDTYDPSQSGKLQNKAGLPKPWVSADAGAAADAEFLTNVGLGQLGTGDEKGLLGGMMALTPPLATSGANAGFLRPDAGLYTVIISDEEDSSCSPVIGSGTAKGEGCTDGDIVAQGGYGTTDYWSRFYSGVREPAVSKIAAIVATDTTFHDCSVDFAGFCDADIGTSCQSNNQDCHVAATGPCCTAIQKCQQDLFSKAQWCFPQYSPSSGATRTYTIGGSFNGCIARNPSDGGVDFTAFTGARYAAVAEATGGIASSICDADYTPTLEQLGLQASGLKSVFPLSRAPIETSITVQVTTPPSTTPVTLQPGAGTWQYERCSGNTAVNSIVFTDAARPAAKAHLAISYNVNVRGVGTCP